MSCILYHGAMENHIIEQSDALRSRLENLLSALEHGLIERRREVRLVMLAALAGEHTLLVGPPGTAKSELARRLHLAFENARYFERLLTRFSVPEELFGPLSISALEQDRYERQTKGFLPQAEIAFIDEVFKANSAILNALLTLLNEREFDNGAGREKCPLISVIGATNDIPEDEVSEAFFDRFLLRLPVGSVAADNFRHLLDADAGAPLPPFAALTNADAKNIRIAAQAVTLADDVVELLGELRQRLAGQQLYVSDRRWVKVAWLLKVAAATEGRREVVIWDLWLLTWCAARDLAHQVDIGDWLTARLGVREAFAPPRLTQVVVAFEAQADIEQQADDLDYDEAGRLKFSTALDVQANDGKDATQGVRLNYTRRRRYGATHIAARVGQIDDLVQRIADYLEEVDAQRTALAAYGKQSLWLDASFAVRADANLATTIRVIEDLRQRALAARAAFEVLPRLAEDNRIAPEPMGCENTAP